jgi:hypothetical protein
MKRRRLVTALEGITRIGIFFVGSGAFNFGNAERTVSSAEIDDRQVFLKLTQRVSGERSEVDDVLGTIDFNFPGENNGYRPMWSLITPQEVETDLIYRYDQNAAGDETTVRYHQSRIPALRSSEHAGFSQFRYVGQSFRYADRRPTDREQSVHATRRWRATALQTGGEHLPCLSPDLGIRHLTRGLRRRDCVVAQPKLASRRFDSADEV